MHENVSKNPNPRSNRNKLYVHKKLNARICLLELDARKFSCAKISTFSRGLIKIKVLT